MAVEANTIPDLSMDAGEDLSDYQYHIVGLSLTNTVVLADGDEVIPIGILQNKPESGRAASVRVGGISKVKLGGTVTVGAHLAESSGKAVITTTDKDFSIGICRKAGVINDIGEVYVDTGYIAA